MVEPNFTINVLPRFHFGPCQVVSKSCTGTFSLLGQKTPRFVGSNETMVYILYSTLRALIQF